ncbi:MAG TPA: metallophosphoesterase [Candidatus Gastranaerophilaceae bacterium]|nr:metallophosphoesterase [Candidatus Gastranaerophilaceae bacterium]
MKRKNRKRKKESFFKKLTNSLFVVFLAAVIFCGLQVMASADNLSFVQISDAHFSTAKTNTSYRLLAESGEVLEDAINQVNETPNVDFVMFTGDMINTAYEKQLMQFLPYANKLKCPWYAVFGNHDISIGGYLSKQLYLDILKSHNKNFIFSKQYYSFSPKKGYKVIALDCIIDDRITANGQINEEQLRWLDKELSKSKKDTVLIFLHMPLVEPLNSPNHRILNTDETLAIIEKYKNPIAIFSGHYHATKITQKDNVLHVSTPSLVSYPNAFRLVRIHKQKNKVIFDIYLKETRYKDVQKRAKMMIFGANKYYGADEDRNSTFIIEKK